MTKRMVIFLRTLLETQLIVIILLVLSAPFSSRPELNLVGFMRSAILLQRIGLGIRQMSPPSPEFLAMLTLLSRTKFIATLIR